jgi:hypothetical protein
VLKNPPVSSFPFFPPLNQKKKKKACVSLSEEYQKTVKLKVALGKMSGAMRLTDLHSMFADAGGAGSGEPVALPFCLNCRHDGHAESSCPEPRRCFICLHPSHGPYQCTANPVPGSVAYNQDVRCSICGDRGHIDSYCRSRGGPHFNKPLSRAVAESTYPKPLVLRTAEGNGPKEETLREARQQVLAVLRRCNPAAVVGTKMRDAELFHTALPALRDPAVAAADQAVLRKALATLRSAVVGSLTLDGVPAKGRRGEERSRGGPADGGQLSGDVLHDMRVSGLNLNVMVGERVETFKRAPAVPQGQGKTRATRCLVMVDCSAAVQLSSMPPRTAQVPHASQPAVPANASARPNARLQQLRHSLDEAQRSVRGGGPADACSAHSLAKPSKQYGQGTPGELSVSASAFTSSLPEHMESRTDVARKILAQWEDAKPRVPSAPNVARPSSASSGTLDVPNIVSAHVNTPQSCGMCDDGIISWPRYYFTHSQTQQQPHPPGRVQGWRQRFEAVKVAKSAALTDYLQRREAHRAKVFEADERLHQRLAAAMHVAEEDAAAQDPTAVMRRASPRPATAVGGGGVQSHQSFWTPTCRVIAERAACSVLASRFRSVLQAFADRQKYASGGEGAVVLAAVWDFFAEHPEDTVLSEAAFRAIVAATCRQGEPATAEGIQLVSFIVQLCRDVQANDDGG